MKWKQLMTFALLASIATALVFQIPSAPESLSGASFFRANNPETALARALVFAEPYGHHVAKLIAGGQTWKDVPRRPTILESLQKILDWNKAGMLEISLYQDEAYDTRCALGCLFTDEQLQVIHEHNWNSTFILELAQPSRIGKLNLEYVTGMNLDQLYAIQEVNDDSPDELVDEIQHAVIDLNQGREATIQGEVFKL